ncbi:hypothetical protein BDN72DRAFT_894559 [Pluteus cervinus]|uniref:Uncharacterized protein n=1 Tax=Pluteus cervinus TaxID=181527 RepID=A0ACD3B540_9AGAR|nr:hypothetical protein BDN72DRAFT_894559 [Pluteus cervinus]
MADGYHNLPPRDPIVTRGTHRRAGRPRQPPYSTTHRGTNVYGYNHGPPGPSSVSNIHNPQFSDSFSSGWSNNGPPGYYQNHAAMGGNGYATAAPSYTEAVRSYPLYNPSQQNNGPAPPPPVPDTSMELYEALKAAGISSRKAGVGFDADTRDIMRHLLKAASDATAARYRLEAKVARLTNKLTGQGVQDVPMTPAQPVVTNATATMTVNGVSYGPKATYPIVIPAAPLEDIIGTTKWLSGSVTERHNAFGGALGPHMYYSASTNAVYTGQSAGRVAAAEKEGAVGYPYYSRIYHTSPKGFPNTLAEWDALIKLVANPAISVLMAWEIFIIIKEFIRLSRAVAVHLRDEVMIEATATSFTFTPTAVENMEDVYPTVFRDENALVRRGGSVNTGLTVPVNPFDLDNHARWLMTHHHPGGSDAAKGVVMNLQFKVDCSSLFAYALGRTLVMGNSKEDRRAWMDNYAMLCSLPHKYAEYLGEHAMDGAPQSGASSIVIFPISITIGSGRNVTMETVMEALRVNNIPASWIDTGFGFGVNYSELREESMNVLWTNAGPDRAARLMEFGTPEVIPELKKWWCPSYMDMERIRFVVYKEIRSERFSHVLTDAQWAEIGTDPWVNPVEQPDAQQLRTRALATIEPGRIVARRNSCPSGSQQRMDEDNQ